MAAEDDTAPTKSSALVIQSKGDFTRFGDRTLSPYEQQRVRLMHERAPVIVRDAARKASVDISYLGISDLFDEARVYQGVDTDWVLVPVDSREPAVLPRSQQVALGQLVDARVAPFLTYAAHEIHRAKSVELVPELLELGQTIVAREKAYELIGQVPEHPRTVDVAQRLDQHSKTVISAIRKGAPIAGAALLGVLAAPFIVAGAVVGSLATLDPILIGAVPILRAEVGEPAAFFELARWDW